MPRVIAPNPSRDDEFFWAGVRDGKLLIASCARCGSLQHPPSPMCPACASLEWTPTEVSGRGTVLSWVVSHHPTEADDRARVVALIELEEGVRLVSNLVDMDVSDVRNDMAVQVTFAEIDGVRLHQFRPAS